MKTVILAGGLGTRIVEETILKPKPMIEIGGKPIIWHLMKIYSSQGFNEFIICCGYKGYMIKEYFHNYFIHNSDVTFDLSKNKYKIHKKNSENWKVTLVDTGETTQTGGRLKRVSSLLEDSKPFFFTYGDGLSDIDLKKLLKFHKKNKKKATLTAVHPPERYGVIELNKNKKDIIKFSEKPFASEGLINGGYFVLEKSCLKYISNDQTIWEREPLENLAEDNHLGAFKHKGFWRPIDTMRDKIQMDKFWKDKKAPWKLWND